MVGLLVALCRIVDSVYVVLHRCGVERYCKRSVVVKYFLHELFVHSILARYLRPIGDGGGKSIIVDDILLALVAPVGLAAGVRIVEIGSDASLLHHIFERFACISTGAAFVLAMYVAIKKHLLREAFELSSPH